MIDKSFLFTGNAVFAVRNPAGTAYTYKLTTGPVRLSGEFFASVVEGSTSRYIGMVRKADLTLRYTQGSTVLPEEMAARVLVFALRLVAGTIDLAKLPPGYSVEPAGTLDTTLAPFTVERGGSIGGNHDEPPAALFEGEGGTVADFADSLRACTGATSVTVTDGPVKATSSSLVDLARQLERGS